MIEVEGLSKSYGSIPALREVSFRVAAGEIVGLLGPNGSGKTTLLRILTGFFPADRGRARVAGVELSDDPFEVRRRVGYLPEQSPLYPEVSVRRFLRFAADVKLGDPERRDERVDAVIAECGLEGVQNRRIGTLSKGYRQRVGIAQALVHRPRVLLLDEPASGLDPAHQMTMMAAFRRLAADRRRAILVSLHDLTLAARWCDRIVMLKGGGVVAEGAPSETLTADTLRDVFGISAWIDRDEGGLVLAPTGLASP